MENVLLIMTLLCLLAGVFKNSLAPGRYYPLVFAVLCAAAVWFSGRYAVRVNKLSVSEALEDFKVMQDVNIVVTLHLLLILGFAASKLKKVFGLARPWYLRMLEYLPALLVLPAFFYLYLSLLFFFVGIPFGWMGGILSVLALLLVGGGAYLLRMAVPEEELRVELLLMMEFLLFVLMLCSTIFHPAAIVFSPETRVDWASLVYTALVIVVLFGFGFAWRVWRQRRSA